MYPVPQEHLNDPYVSVHVWLHPPLLVWHSSTSMKHELQNFIHLKVKLLPSQFRLSTASVYPVPQEHSNDPYLLVHVWLHPPLLVWHSSTSIKHELRNFIHLKVKLLPSQSRSSTASLYPVPQEHSNDPYMSVHVWLHPPLLVWHSSTSIKHELRNFIHLKIEQFITITVQIVNC